MVTIENALSRHAGTRQDNNRHTFYHVNTWYYGQPCMIARPAEGKEEPVFQTAKGRAAYTKAFADLHQPEGHCTPGN